MRLSIFATIGLAALLIAGASQAQVDYSDIKTGTVLDGKGIRLGAFVKPVPLPPGTWQVLQRTDNPIRLTGGDGSFNSTNEVQLTLKSTDAGNGIFAIVMNFAPDSLRIRWQSTCVQTGQRIAFSINPNGGGAEACAWGNLTPGAGMRNFFKNAPNHTSTYIKNHYGVLAPYADESPASIAVLSLVASRMGGRKIEYAFYAHSQPNALGTPFENEVQTWLKATAQAAVDMLDNTLTPMPAFPKAAAAPAIAAPMAAAGGKARELGGAELDTLQPGSEVSNAMGLPNSSAPLPLPPGRWIVAGRHDYPMNGQVVSTLTLRNSDLTAPLAALVMTVQPAQFNPVIAMGRCQAPVKSQFQITEDLGTTANSAVTICAVGGLYSASLKQMVHNAPTSSDPWFKENLSALAPYEADMPNAHIWLSLDTGRNGQTRVQWALYSRAAAGLRPGNVVDGPLREWVRAMGQSMLSFHNNQYSAIAPYPVLAATP